MGFLRLRFRGGVCLLGGLGCGKYFTFQQEFGLIDVDVDVEGILRIRGVLYGAPC